MKDIFQKLKAEVKEVNFETVRTEKEDYFEAVILAIGMEKLVKILEGYLKQPVWPREDDLPEHIQEAIKEFGGVMKGQTLYYLKEGSSCIFAMLWPWQNKQHITLKMGLK